MKKTEHSNKKILDKIKKIIAPSPLIYPYAVLDDCVKAKFRRELLTFITIGLGCIFLGTHGGSIFFLMSFLVLFIGFYAAWDTYYSATRNKITKVEGVITSVNKAGYRRQYTEVHIQDYNDVCYMVYLYTKTRLTSSNEVLLYIKNIDDVPFKEGEYVVERPFLLERKNAKIVNTTKDE